MRAVVADTGPLHYLVLIDAVDILPRMFGSVLVPEIVVSGELSRSRTPAAIRQWLATQPAWLDVRPTPDVAELPLPLLGDGERAAIALATALHADLILMDDREGVAAARAEGFGVIGTLGLLDRAAHRGLIDIAAAVARLKATNFRVRSAMLDALLPEWRKKGGSL